MNAFFDTANQPDSRFFGKAGFNMAFNRNTVSDDKEHICLSNGGIALCITVYNEPADALYSSLAELAKNIVLIRQVHRDIPVNICILVDGLPKCAQSMKSALERLIGPDDLPLVETNDLVCYFRKTSIHSLSSSKAFVSEIEIEVSGSIDETRLPFLDTPDDFSSKGAQAVNLLIAIKGENCGKLDSHWWFYRVFCPILSPTYCFQMDVGTLPAADAVLELTDAFEQDPRIGAVASSIMPPQPTDLWDLLQSWQYISFANCVLLEWPAECVAGYLSVVPGQLSAFRWNAIKDERTPVSVSGRNGPLDVYFKGLGPLTPQESMLYLAEDRVLCREIVSNPRVEWAISHVDNAWAITDSCQSWGELLRQRKRWCNGYMACRINYLRNLPEFICDPAVILRRKMRAATAGLYHSLILLMDWCTPAISVLFLLSLGQHSISLLQGTPLMQGGLRALMFATTCALSVQFFLCYRGKLSARSIILLRFSILAQASLVAISFILNLMLGEAKLLAASALFLSSVGAIASLIGHRKHTRTLALSMPIVLLTTYIIPHLMWTYAICNVHDYSWGTKGLLSVAQNSKQANSADTSDKSRFRRFRRRYILAWATSNISLCYFFGKWCTLNDYHTEVILLCITSSTMLLGLICRACTALARKLKRAHADV